MVVILFIFIGSGVSMAQDSSSVITQRPAFLGTTYFQGKHVITKGELERLLLSSKDRTTVILTSTEKSYSTVSFIPAFIGGFCIGYGAFSKPVNATLVISGIVSVVGAYIIGSAADSDLNGAVNRYNSEVLEPPEKGPSNGAGRNTLQIGFTEPF